MSINKLALVGIGKIARDQHIPAIGNDPEWMLSATVSRNASVDGIENYTSIEALINARPDIRTISLAIPTKPRFDYARKALAAGLNVMLEKPPGASLAECLSLESMARMQGVSLYATWHARHAEGISQAREWLAERSLKRLHVNWKEDVRTWHPGQEWVWEPGGLGVFDPGINALSIMTEILPVPVHLASATLEIPSNRQTPIAAVLKFSHPNGADVHCDFDWREPGDPIWQVAIETDNDELELSFGSASMNIEYQRLYRRMAELTREGAVEMDLSPLTHVADAYMLGRRVDVEPFHF